MTQPGCESRCLEVTYVQKFIPSRTSLLSIRTDSQTMGHLHASVSDSQKADL